jgi:uncharacterized coiled-coil protein SlyX
VNANKEVKISVLSGHLDTYKPHNTLTYMTQRHCLSKSGVRQLARKAAGGLCLGVLLAWPNVITPHASFAQSSDTVANAGDEDMSLDFVKQQLARVRAGTPAAGDGASGQAIQDENARLLAEESALLNQISGRDSGLDTESSSTKASVDMDKALDALTTSKNESAVAIVDESELEVVRGSIPAVGHSAAQVTDQKARAQGKIVKVSNSDAGTAASAPVVAPAVRISAGEIQKMEALANEESDENPVALLLGSEESSAQPARAPRATESASNLESKMSAEASAAVRPSELEARLANQQANVANLQRTNGDLRRQLDTFQRKLREATKELEQSRNRLMIAETEVERLSISLEQRNRNNLARVAPGVGQVQPVRAYRAPQQAQAPQAAPAQRSAATAQRAAAPAESSKVKPDMLIATVIADKANLRSGAGKNNSPLMTVSRGTRLAVETRNGDWYRVITPTGTRAWVNSEVLSFGPDNQASPTRTVRMSGVRGDEGNVTLASSSR